MAYLFHIEANIAIPTTEVLLVSPFKEIWERDTDVKKERALKEFTYMEFMTSKKRSNPYAGYSEEDRHKKLIDLLFSEDWKMDTLMEQGMAKIVEFQKEASPTYTYYMANLVAAGKMRDFLDTFDMSEKNNRTGLPIYKASEITKAIIDTDKVLQNLNNMKEKVEQELFEQTKTKGNKQINPFEI